MPETRRFFAVAACSAVFALCQNDNSTLDNGFCIAAPPNHSGSVSVVGSDASSGATGSGVGCDIWRW